jgi:hypothetical protein
MALATDLAIILVMASPLLMAFWFAPLLTAWDGVSAGKSCSSASSPAGATGAPSPHTVLALGLVGGGCRA